MSGVAPKQVPPYLVQDVFPIGRMHKGYPSKVSQPCFYFWGKEDFAFTKALKRWSAIYIPDKPHLVPTLERKKVETDVNKLGRVNPEAALLMAQESNARDSAAVGHHKPSTGKAYYDHEIVEGLIHKSSLSWKALLGDPVEWPAIPTQHENLERLRDNYKHYRSKRRNAESGDVLHEDAAVEPTDPYERGAEDSRRKVLAESDEPEAQDNLQEDLEKLIDDGPPTSPTGSPIQASRQDIGGGGVDMARSTPSKATSQGNKHLQKTWPWGHRTNTSHETRFDVVSRPLG